MASVGGECKAGSEITGLPRKKSAEERKARSTRAVANEERHGWQVESQEDFHAVMVRRWRGM